ncbi:unnamed protein product [Toxocara canis]|nr:unnamed protein product [Toxocara canis]
MRDTPLPRRRRNRKNQEGTMEWDDSGMNITVNPLEDVEKTGEFSDDDDSSDGAESYREDDELTEDEEEEAEHVLPHVQNAGRQNSTGLEWDDTTLANVSRTYRV